MRHRVKKNKIGRKSPHRNAMLMNMANSLIEHKRIKTTVAKAKMLRQYVEPIITKSKSDTTHSRRVVFGYLQNKQAVSELFREIAPKVADRPGGYARILKTGFRQGDAAEMCLIELVDFNDVYTQQNEAAKKKTRRSRRGTGAKSETTASVESAVAEDAVEEGVRDEATDSSAEEAEVAEKASAEETPAEGPSQEEEPEAPIEETVDEQQGIGEEEPPAEEVVEETEPEAVAEEPAEEKSEEAVEEKETPAEEKAPAEESTDDAADEAEESQGDEEEKKDE